jgi:hypothetical protein
MIRKKRTVLQATAGAYVWKTPSSKCPLAFRGGFDQTGLERGNRGPFLDCVGWSNEDLEKEGPELLEPAHCQGLSPCADKGQYLEAPSNSLEVKAAILLGANKGSPLVNRWPPLLGTPLMDVTPLIEATVALLKGGHHERFQL